MKILINLFPHQQKTAVDRLVYFGLHYLRHILVITQFVAICVFFYRFTVDQQIVDLRDTLAQKDSIVEATSSLIKSVEELDIKIKNVKTVLSLQTTMQETYTYVFSKIPENIDVSKLSIEGELVQIEGVSASSESIRDFFETIKNEEKFENSELSNIQRDPAGYNFSIQLQGFKI